MRVGRVAGKVSSTTLAKNFKADGFDVKWRPAREGQTLDKQARAERLRICSKWRYLPSNYWTHKVDAILDNKKFHIPIMLQHYGHSSEEGLRDTCGHGQKALPNSARSPTHARTVSTLEAP